MLKNKLRSSALILALALAVSLFCGCAAPADGIGENVQSADAESEQITEEYELKGKTFIFLGSSVTYGSAADGRSFVELIAERCDCTCIKWAVSGTTLAETNDRSYVSRLRDNSVDVPACDHLIVQLSTNDASNNIALGTLSESKSIADFDTKTVIGAIEYIIAYAKEKWDCPVSFYTGTKYTSSQYQSMVDALLQIKEKWDIGVLDLYNDPEMNAVTSEDYQRYMADPIHPTDVGYEDWWLPKFEQFLLDEGQRCVDKVNS